MLIKTQSNGFALIEVVVTMFVMAVGLLGLSALQSVSVKNGLDTGTRSQVIWVVTELTERIRANPDADGNSYVKAAFTPADCAAPTKRCADNSAGAAATNCTANEMAAYDVWDSFCGQSAGTGVLANATESLDLQSLSITCNSCGTTVKDSNYTVSVSWISESISQQTQVDQASSNFDATVQQTRTISMPVYP
ncbi:type IV pilus modification protein PilV [Oceanicoccus sp. KOV_DT_Chl]|uniref:type IV pilus modification protein PilV n=1 Tax=Oceanicoccus sp. KOV_DT_Chl TaxID=1904639 RepID=UPI0013572BF9|nr:type IV pilus modification protein PilV [Oceanicoccus sp. KOV_DT_Chl]